MKIKKLLFIALACTSLSGCGFGEDDGNIDTTLYELKLTSNLDKAKTGLNAELSRERSQDEIDELLENGATQADIDKSGTCINGTYYFYDQDPVNLSEPFLPGYEFLGWYQGNQWLGYLDTDYDGNPEYIWNMDNKNVTLEARFQLITYTILYMDEETGPARYTENPTTWNVEQEEIVLNHADRSAEGLKFDGWTFAMGGGTFYDGYVTKINEQFLVDSGAARVTLNGAGATTFSLHENYSVLNHDITLTFDTSVFDYVIIDVTPVGETRHSVEVNDSHFLYGGSVEFTAPHAAQITVYPKFIDSDLYEVDGVYLGDNKISTVVTVGQVGYSFTSTQDGEVELRWTAKN